PFHRSYVQAVFDSYLREEVVPFIWNNCQSQGIAISTMGASFGAYHAANSLFKHPDVIKRCFAMSGVYDVRNFMDGMYDDNFYFNNPVDYLVKPRVAHVCEVIDGIVEIKVVVVHAVHEIAQIVDAGHGEAALDDVGMFEERDRKSVV